jgi:hypothetical protein
VEAGLGENQYVSSGVSGYLGYFSKLIYNTFSLGLLNSFETEAGRVYLLNIGFWQHGVFIIAGILWAIKEFFGETNVFEKNISVIIIVALLCLSYGSFIQPRYLMPLSYFLVLGFVRCIGCRRIALLFAIAVPVILYVSYVKHGVPEVGNDVSWTW